MRRFGFTCLRRVAPVAATASMYNPHHSFCCGPQQPMLRTTDILFSASRRFYSRGGDDADDHLDMDVMGDLEIEAAQMKRQRTLPTDDDLATMIRAMIPENCYSHEVFSSLQAYFRKTRINNFIPTPKAQITLIENEDGTEKRADNNKPMDIEQAIAAAASLNKDLVMMGENKGVAYCKIRNEKTRALKSIEELVERARLANETLNKKGGAGGRGNRKDGSPKKELPPAVYDFRDVMDAHAVGWRSRKVVEDLKRVRTVKLVVNRFVSPESAVGKMQEFMYAIKTESQNQQPPVAHTSTVRLSPDELSVVLTPTLTSTEVKHPGEKDWEKTLSRMSNLIKDTGRSQPGTYRKFENKKKKMSLGIRQSRVDAFGQELSD